MNGTTSSRLPNALQLLSWIGLATSLVTLALSTLKLVEDGGRWGGDTRQPRAVWMDHRATASHMEDYLCELE